MATISPTAVLKRSFVHHKLGENPVGGQQQAERAGLLDLSLLPRAGFRGAKVPDHLAQAGLPVPEKPNQASVSEQGEWVLRLSPKEFWVLGSLQDEGARVDAWKSGIRLPAGNYPLYCQDSHAWLALTGSHLPDIMAKVCGVDLRPAAFPVGGIAQTSVARINAIVVHHTLNGHPCFSLLFDSASAEYLWDALLDAMQEFGGMALDAKALA